MKNIKISSLYLFILMFGLFALNIGQTFSSSNYPFLIILFLGIGLTFLSILSKKDLNIGKTGIIYFRFVVYAVISTLWATSSKLAITGSLVVILTFFIIVVFYTMIIDSKIQIYDLLGYVCWAAVLTYIYLIIKYGIAVTWSLRDENFAASKVYNANGIGKLYILGALMGYEKYRYSQYSNKKYMYMSIFLLALGFLSGSKSNLLFVMIYFTVLLYLKQKNAGERAIVVIFIPIVFLVVYWSIMNNHFLYNIVGYRFEELINIWNGDVEKYSSSWYRLSMYQNGITAFIKKPIMGYGMTNAALYNTFEYEYQEGVYLHSNYIELLVDLGIVGTALYYSLYYFALKGNIKKYKEGNRLSMSFIAIICSFLITDIYTVSYLNRPTVLIIIMISLFAEEKISMENQK